MTLPAGLISVKVTPKAAFNRVKTETLENGGTLYRVYVTVTAERGKANEAVIGLLAEHFGVSKSSVTIVGGHTSRNKLIKITWSGPPA